MREFPLFIPYGDERVAAMLTVPDEDPRGLVLLLQLFGVGRSHKNGLWTRTARGLAARGLASVRMDYVGLGDSTGGVPPVVGWDKLPVGESLAVTEVAARLIGVESIAVAGNCYGARTALAFAARLGTCVTAAVVPPGAVDALLEPRRLKYSSPSGRKLRALAKRSRVAGWALEPILRATRPPATTPRKLVPEVAAALRSTDLLFAVMEDGELELRQALDLLFAGNAGAGRRVHVETIAKTEEPGRSILTIQHPVEAVVTRWMDEAFRWQPRGEEQTQPLARPIPSAVPSKGDL